ncbi:hypothetical protein [Hymenobacter sp. HDW8]|uniref:hypothetical protein n=1 Tax=Hymenobacter sp. HDW8 TaxID=2714932 RepID=UPI00140C0886|nr:hypothetical protein [Hymenobacter sp. HDW8]QIL78426.1 hypothetical protein G7064_21640 [Hymenobacter sp. HDW8]
MNESRYPRLAALATSLFAQPISKNYLGLSIILIVLGGFVVYTDNNFPDVAKHLVMVAIMLGIARLFNPQPMRWAWVGVVGIMSLLLALDVAILFV